MVSRRQRRRLTHLSAGLAVVAGTAIPLVSHSGSAAAATTRSLGPGTNIVVHGVSARLEPLAAGAAASPHVVLPRLTRQGGRTGSAQRTPSGSTYAAPGSTGMRAIDADRGTSPSARVSSGATPAVAQLQAIQGVTRNAEKGAFNIEATPPDTQVAVSPTQIVEAVNTVALVMDHTGGNASLFDLSTIWSGLLPGIGTTKDISDPRIVWDSAAQRWFVSMVVFDDALLSSPNPVTSHSWVALAASQGIAPTMWNAYVIQGPGGQLLDQPGLGVNSDKVTSSSSNFDFTQANAPFVGSDIYVTNKSEMTSGAASLDITTHFDANAFAYAPAVARSASTTEYVAFNNNGVPGQAQMLSVVAVTGLPTSSTSAAFTQHNIVMCPACGTAAVTSVPPAIPQPGTAVKVDSGDDRLGNAVWQNGALWTGGNTGIDAGLGPQAALYLAEVNTGAFSLPVLEQLFSSAGTSFVYPGIDLDANGTPFLAFSRGSSTRYMSGGAFAFDAGTGTLMSAGVVNGGAGSYFYDCSAICGANVSRWGDYSGAAVDPSDPNEVWTADEYSATTPGNTLNWGTVLNRLTVSAPTITSIDAHSSRTTGGTVVRVTGTEFDPASTSVVFGGTSAPVTQWIDDHHVVTVAPPHAPGSFDVNAANAFGISAPLPGAFTYVEPPVRGGYWMVASDGGIFAFATAGFHGSMGATQLNQPIVGMAGTPDGNGYWLVASDGGIFAFNAPFKGSTGGIHLNQPIVGMAPTASGQGYWLVASDGGVFAFGDAQFHGSMGATHLNQPIVGMAATATGAGYWLVAADGGIFAFGDAQFHGSMGATHLNKPIVGMVPTSWGGGYWLVASDGGIFAFAAPFKGSAGALPLVQPVVGMAQAGDDNGYWLVARDGGIFAYGDAAFHGSMGGQHLNQPIVGMASQPA